MLRQFVSPDEFFADHNIARYCDRASLPLKLSAAERETRELLRARKANTRQLQLPQMLAGTYPVPTSVSADATGDTCQIRGSRFVVEIFTDDTNAVFTLEGSEDETNWRTVYDRMTGTGIRIEAFGAGIYSAPFAESYPYYRYTVTTSAAVSHLPYLVDSSLDLLIEYKTLELIYQDFLGDDLIDRKHDAAVQKFERLMATLAADVDIDGDGTVDTEERDALPVRRVYR